MAEQRAYTYSSLEKDRQLILQAMLPHVPFDGWSEEVARRAMTELGMDPVLEDEYFPEGSIDRVAAFIHFVNGQLHEELEKTSPDDMRVRDRITYAVRKRIEIQIPYKEAVHKALGILTQPIHVPKATTLLWSSMDDIWYWAGDASTDYNYYTKRTLLGGVYTSTILYWLSDTSEDYADTWAFLDRRIANVLQFGKLTSRLTRRFCSA